MLTRPPMPTVLVLGLLALAGLAQPPGARATSFVSMDDGDLAAIEDDNCMGCGLCQVGCPTDAIGLEVAKPEDCVPA